jgi:hypothetical protein
MKPFLIFLFHLALVEGGTPQNTSAHNLHVSYGKMAVEGSTIYLSVRFFRDDLETALRKVSATSDLKLAATPRCDSIYLRYFNEKFELSSGGKKLRAEFLSSGEDGEMWWYKFSFSDAKPLQSVSVRNTLMFEMFDDQKNIFQLMHFPSEAQQSFYFIRGAESYTASF